MSYFDNRLFSICYFFCILLSILLLFELQKYMPGKKVEDISHNYVECLLYTFHHLAHKVRFGHQL